MTNKTYSLTHSLTHLLTVFPCFILLICIFLLVLFLFRAIESSWERHGNDEQWNEGSRETHHRNGKVVWAVCLPLEQVRIIQRLKRLAHFLHRLMIPYWYEILPLLHQIYLTHYGKDFVSLRFSPFFSNSQCMSRTKPNGRLSRYKYNITYT